MPSAFIVTSEPFTETFDDDDSAVSPLRSIKASPVSGSGSGSGSAGFSVDASCPEFSFPELPFSDACSFFVSAAVSAVLVSETGTAVSETPVTVSEVLVSETAASVSETVVDATVSDTSVSETVVTEAGVSVCAAPSDVSSVTVPQEARSAAVHNNAVMQSDFLFFIIEPPLSYISVTVIPVYCVVMVSDH